MKSTNLPADTDDVAAAISSEPVRLLAGSGSDWERRLLASASADRVPASSLTRLARALDVPRSALPAAARGGLGSLSPLVKGGSLVGLGAVGLLVVAAVRHASAPNEAPTRAPDEVAAPSPWVAPAPIVVPLPEPRMEPVESKLPSRVGAPRTATKPKPTPEGLRAELSALEAVQRALRAGHTKSATAALDSYARRFPNGELALEAERLGADIARARSERGDGVNEARLHMKKRR